ncbi:MAG: hypothetical protein MJZ68_03015 [archaeon]|nr:hypothetical protein [archaeon]
MARYCPNCGATVPPNSLTCPQCYTEIARDMTVNERDRYEQRSNTTRETYREQISKRNKSPTIAMVLAVVPAFLGFLGLGQIYRDPRDQTGYYFLAGGLATFLIMVALIVLGGFGGILGTILVAIPTIIFGLIYFLIAIVSIVDAYFGSIRIFGMKR